MSTGYFFLELIEGLKNLPRRGWVIRNVPDPESVGDHMYRVALMCLMQPDYDDETRKRAVYMALVHDIGEAIIGDITPSDGISPDDKRIREEMALKFLACTIRDSHPAFADSMLDLWYEYEENSSPAAKLVKQVDKLECIHQAVVYEQRYGAKVDLSHFMNLQKKVTLSGLKPLLDDCLRKHEELEMRKETELIVVFVSGGPGVGKGTQCALLAEEFGFHHISVGDLLREEAARPESPYREFIPESIQKSILLPAQLTTQLLNQAMGRAQAQGKHRFLLDGFPRSVAQAVDFEASICKDYATISLNCSEDELMKRIQQRSKMSGRIDDNPASMVKRLQTFNENNAEVLEHLRQRGPMFEVDCHGSVEEIYASTRETVQTILHKQTKA